MWIQIDRELLCFFGLVRILFCEQSLVEPRFAINRMRRRYPVYRRFDLSAVRRRSAPGRGIIPAMDLNNTSRRILYNAVTGYKIAVPKPYLPSRRETEVTFWRIFAKVVLFDVQHLRKRDLARAHALVFRIVDRFHLFNKIVR